MNRVLSVAAVLFATAWLAHGLNTYWPFLSGEITSPQALQAAEELHADLSRQLGRPSSSDVFLTQYKVVVVGWALVQVFGFALSVAALLLPQRRAVLVLSAGALYLGAWLWAQSWPADISLLEIYALKWRTAQTFNLVGGLVLKDFVLPVVFMAGCIFSLVSLSWQRLHCAGEA
jgi:hypothetical protein